MSNSFTLKHDLIILLSRAFIALQVKVIFFAIEYNFLSDILKSQS